MKHPLRTTILLVLLFVVAQAIGLGLVNKSIVEVQLTEGGETVLAHSDTAIGERPALSGYQSFLYLLFGVAIGTALLLLLIRFKKVRIWKMWFFLAVFLAQSVAFGVLLPQLIALTIAFILALLKIYRPNPVVHNLTEVFMYAGIAVLLVPIFDVAWALLLLIAISFYDAWAVWRSKHMVAMAEFQKSSDVFAGLMVPKRGEPMNMPAKSAKSTASARQGTSKKIDIASVPSPSARGSVAILGGGDIAFPLIFSGAVMEGYILSGFGKLAAFSYALLVTFGATLALLWLFVYAKKDTYYPAMPFLTAGCLFGWLLSWLATLL